MTTLQIPRTRQSEALAQALTDAAHFADRKALAALTELRVAADPTNHATVANVSWAEHPVLAAALRNAADHGVQLGDQLRAMADTLDAQITAAAVNIPHLRHLVPPAPSPQPVAEAPEPAPTLSAFPGSY